jgi:hypothetical protein
VNIGVSLRGRANIGGAAPLRSRFVITFSPQPLVSKRAPAASHLIASHVNSLPALPPGAFAAYCAAPRPASESAC